MTDAPASGFAALGLRPELLQALDGLGYEAPTPIQLETIPQVLAGHDVLGQAQTGTGKTAAFALPVLSRIDMKRDGPQALVLAPTRELALQVAEAFQSYAKHMPGMQVLPVYGGQGYDMQLRQLKRGVQIVVGTPGRVMDHIERGTLKLDNLQTLVLDEADEMLRMGFIDAVEWILQHTPAQRQIALFSATMPKEIRRVADAHLKDPVVVKIASKTTTATTIRQRYWQATGLSKLDALTRILEVEDFDAMLVFVRTKMGANELSEKLSSRGFLAEALNGDIPQIQRERIIERFKGGRLDIVVATDVAARGLDVDRISHVVNYDIPYDTESYVHRIGRTGRAGRSGEAILFVAPRENRMLKAIEKATGQVIERMTLPTVAEVNRVRIERLGVRIGEALENPQLALYESLLEGIQQSREIAPMKLAAALAALLQGDQPFLLDTSQDVAAAPAARREREGAQEGRERRSRKPDQPGADAVPLREFPDIAMQRYRIDVGHVHGVKPGNIVGAIANEGDIDSRYIGHVDIYEDFSTVDLPEGMPKDVQQQLRKARICGRPSGFRLMSEPAPAVMEDDGPRRPRKPNPGKGGKPPAGKPQGKKHRKDNAEGNAGRKPRVAKPSRKQRGD